MKLLLLIPLLFLVGCFTFKPYYGEGDSVQAFRECDFLSDATVDTTQITGHSLTRRDRLFDSCMNSRGFNK